MPEINSQIQCTRTPSTYPYINYFEIKLTALQHTVDKMLSYSRKTALQGALVLAKSGRLKLEDNILRTL